MSTEERAKLKTLLGYWIEHSREHGEEFKEWADKVKEMGDTEIAGELLEAVRDMDRATECLSRALKGLDK